MRQYPIYNFITGQGKASTADFGSHEGFRQIVRVGGGSRNSHELAEIQVTRHTDRVGRVLFKLWVDGKVIKAGVYEPETKEFNIQN